MENNNVETKLDNNLVFIVMVMLAMLFIPYWSGYFYVHGQFPPGYFQFPPIVAPPKPGFALTGFIIGALLFTVAIMLYLFPRLFGFKKTPPDANLMTKTVPLTKVAFPKWFWVGLVMWGGTLFLLWGHFKEPRAIIDWAAVFLYWGFTFMLDGIVYKRNGGQSMFSETPRELIGVGLASVWGWMMFEFLNFFVDDNWCYPMGIKLPKGEFVIYAIVGSSGLMPMALEWYSFFNSFDKLKYRYSFGPQITFSKGMQKTLLAVSLIAMAVIPFFPAQTFALLWLTPMLIMASVLGILNIWTPFTGLKEGNWSPLLLCALAFGVQGFLCEFWNYFSGTHDASGTFIFSHNPDYWTYSIPYVDKFHVFEMPVLGLLGYFPFGIYCAVWWIAFAYLLNIRTEFFDDVSKSVKPLK